MKKINTKPELSIVIAHYRSNTIKRVVNNFLSMKDVKLEIFLINDHTEKINQNQIFLKDKRVKYFQHKKNKGPLATFYEGIKMSKADYVMISSDHDYFNKNSLKKIINPIKNNKNYVAGFSNFNVIDEKGKKLLNYKKSINHFSYLTLSSNFFRALRFYLDAEYNGKSIFVYSIIKRKFFDKKKFYDFHKKYSFNADRIFIYDLIQKNKIHVEKGYHFNNIVHEEKYYKKRLEKTSKINYFFLQILGYFENSKGFILKFLIIVLLPFKLYQSIIRRFIFK